MDGIQIGDRMIPLENSRQYGPKEWALSVDDQGKRTWTEIPMSESKQEVARLNATIWWASHPTWERTIPITQADLDKHNLPDSYLDGMAVFPSPMFYPTGKGAEAEMQRVKAEGIWMTRYKDMEARQTIIRPPDKPEDSSSTGRYFQELKRGD